MAGVVPCNPHALAERAERLVEKLCGRCRRNKGDLAGSLPNLNWVGVAKPHGFIAGFGVCSDGDHFGSDDPFTRVKEI